MSAIPSISALAAPLEGEYYSKIINKAEDVVEKAAAVFKEAGVAVTEKEVPQGRASPVATIVDYAAEEKTDLIAMGTRGMGGVKRAVLGSVSSAVAMHAPCATLVVRSTKGKGGARPVGRLMVAVDGSENAQRALEAAVDMTTRMKLELQIVHVDYVPGLLWSMGLPGSMIPTDRIEKDAESYGEQLVSKAVKFAKDGGVANPKGEMVTKLTSPAQAIVELAEKRDVDVILIGTRGLGGFRKMLLGSVANSVLHYAHCSVLIVK